MKDNLNTHRLAWVDTARAIGILFVVMGHHRFHALYDYIYSFHMPLFFFLSGMMFRTNSSETLRSFVLKRAQSLLIPYFVFSFILFGIWWFLGSYIDHSLLEGSSITKNLLGIFYSQGQLEFMRWGVEMWFLPCLFLTSILYFRLAQLALAAQVMLVLFCAALGFMLPKLLPVRLPWSIDIALIAVGFFWLGHKLQAWIFSFKLNLKNAAIIFTALFINILFYYFHGARVDMYQAIYGELVSFYLSAFGGILFYVLLARCLPAIGFIAFLGANSLIIYMLHMRSLTVYNFLCHVFPFASINEHTISGTLAISIIQIVILLPAIFIINRFFPFLLGKSLNFSRLQTKLS